jgi:hypothetical protein
VFVTTLGQSSVTATADTQPVPEEHGQRLIAIYGALMLALLLASLDQTIVSTALPAA